MAIYASQLRCVNCDAIAQLKGLVYTCEICGHNLQIEYDYEAIRKSWNKDTLKHNSDYTIWRYMPLYPVETRIDYPPIGWTPLFEVPKLAKTMNLRSLFVKDDGRNPSASFKDRATAIALMRAKELGCDLVTGASTGNAASSTAVLAAVTGIKAKIFIPRTAPRAKVAQIMTFGAEVLAVDGVYDDAFDLCLAATQKFGWYNRNTGYNPFTREGKKSVSFEICEQMAWDVPDLVVVPVGDGNIISGVWKGFQDFYRIGFIDRLPRLLAVQAEHSDAIIRAFEGDGTISPVSGDTVADSISVSIPRDGKAALQAIQQSNGLCMRVSDQEILNAIPTLARNTGVFGEPAASTSLAGLQKAVAQGHIDPNWKIVLLLTGNGLKDIASAIKVAGEPPIIAPNPDALNDMM